MAKVELTVQHVVVFESMYHSVLEGDGFTQGW